MIEHVGILKRVPCFLGGVKRSDLALDLLALLSSGVLNECALGFAVDTDVFRLELALLLRRRTVKRVWGSE